MGIFIMVHGRNHGVCRVARLFMHSPFPMPLLNAAGQPHSLSPSLPQSPMDSPLVGYRLFTWPGAQQASHRMMAFTAPRCRLRPCAAFRSCTACASTPSCAITPCPRSSRRCATSPVSSASSPSSVSCDMNQPSRAPYLPPARPPRPSRHLTCMGVRAGRGGDGVVTHRPGDPGRVRGPGVDRHLHIRRAA